MRPFYFGSSERPLFGVHHPPVASVPERGAVVLCYPFGREYFRAHRAVRELAHQLSGSGLHALRFDYTGCGDSSGEDREGDVGGWVGDVRLAIEELLETSGSRHVSAVGVRLGAALAILATGDGSTPRFRKLALWDPIVVGKRYFEELSALQRAWDLDHPSLASSGGEEDSTEILGFPVTPRLADAIGAIDLRGLGPPPAEEVLVVTSDEDGTTPALVEALRRAGSRVEERRVPGVKFWLRQEGVDQAVVPTQAIRCISGWLGGGTT